MAHFTLIHFPSQETTSKFISVLAQITNQQQCFSCFWLQQFRHILKDKHYQQLYCHNNTVLWQIQPQIQTLLTPCSNLGTMSWNWCQANFSLSFDLQKAELDSDEALNWQTYYYWAQSDKVNRQSFWEQLILMITGCGVNVWSILTVICL